LTWGNVTGLAPFPLTYFQTSVSAAVDAFNKAGGVQGRKVQLITCDTKLNPAQDAACVAKAKSQGVVMAIESLDLIDSISIPILEKQGIPVAAEPSSSQAQYARNTACFLNGPFVLGPAAGGYLAAHGVKRMSYMEPAGVTDGATIVAAINSEMKPHGGKVTKRIPVSPTATNFESLAAEATSSNEQAVYPFANPPGLFSLIGALHQNTPNVKLAFPGYSVQDKDVLGAVNGKINGAFVVNFSALPNDRRYAGIRLFQQQIAKADVTKEAALEVWANTWGAMQILGSIKRGDINAKTIMAAMKKTTVRFQGVIPDWKYRFNTLGLGCVNNNTVYTGTVHGTTITPTPGKPVQGLTPAAIALYKKAFAHYVK